MAWKMHHDDTESCCERPDDHLPIYDRRPDEDVAGTCLSSGTSLHLSWSTEKGLVVQSPKSLCFRGNWGDLLVLEEPDKVPQNGLVVMTLIVQFSPEYLHV
jgi:hypothetical protein